MKLAPLIFIWLGLGCAAVPPQKLMPPRLAQLQTQQSLVVAPPVYTAHWLPGDYTNFVVVTTTKLPLPLPRWATWLQTDQTNFQFVANGPARFFTLYGTNKATGESAWVEGTN